MTHNEAFAFELLLCSSHPHRSLFEYAYIIYAQVQDAGVYA